MLSELLSIFVSIYRPVSDAVREQMDNGHEYEQTRMEEYFICKMQLQKRTKPKEPFLRIGVSRERKVYQRAFILACRSY